MGNAFALKIIKINENCMLKDVVFNHDKRVVENVYFITKINKYYVENFRKNSTINEFTLYNVYTRREYNVVIERVESGFFFEGLEYKLEILPNVEKVLVVSLVKEDGLASICGIEAGETILLGNEERYFSGLNDVENEIEKMNAYFIFFDFNKNIVRRINFEEFRDKSNNQLRMGLEIEVKNVKEINFEKNDSLMMDYISNTICQAKSISDDCKVKESDASNILQDTKQIHLKMNHNPENNLDREIIFPKVDLTINKITIESTSKHEESKGKYDIETIIYNPSNKEIINKNEIGDEKFSVSKDDTFENKHETVIPRDDVFEYSEIIQPSHQEDHHTLLTSSQEKESIQCKMILDVLTKHIDIESKQDVVNNEITMMNRDYCIDLKETISPTTKHTKYSYTQSSLYLEPEKLTSSQMLFTLENFDGKAIQSDYTRSVSKCKEKYSKKLQIYDRIDSNYNFMSSSKSQSLLNEKIKPIATLVKYKLDLGDNFETKDLPNKKVLIKGFQLGRIFDTTLGSNYSKSFRIFDLHQNTKSINLH